LEGSRLPAPPGVASDTTDSRSKIEDEDEFEHEDDYREASCMKSVAHQIKSDR
jgi:hypothetical protein